MRLGSLPTGFTPEELELLEELLELLDELELLELEPLEDELLELDDELEEEPEQTPLELQASCQCAPSPGA